MCAVRYGMVIDTTRCFGCQTCNVGCKMCNQVPGDIFWANLASLDGDAPYKTTGRFPDVRMDFRPLLCNHCLEPRCVAICPTGAMTKDPDTGIVSVDEAVCIGCDSCMGACPYMIPKLDDSSGAAVASKCFFCKDRVKDGELPYCVESCPARARFFGDISDPNSEVSKMIADRGAKVYKEESGTQPSVFYITKE